MLEDRTCPALVWRGQANVMGGDVWSTPANWQDDVLNQVSARAPLSTDTLVFDNGSVVPSTDDMNFGQNSLLGFRITGYAGTITLGQNLKVATMLQTSGTVGG